MLALVLLGLTSIKNIPIEEFPDIKFPVVVVTTDYTGAAPEVIETDISKPLEEALNTINGIKTIRSYSFEGQSVVVAEFNLDINPDTAVQDARDKIATVTPTFKKDVDAPIVSRVNMQDQPIMSLVISSSTMPLRDLTSWINQVAKKKLQTVAGVGDIKLIGGAARQIRINIEPYELQSLGLSANDVVEAVQQSNENYPAGDVRTENKNISVRIDGKLKTSRDFANIVVAYRNDVPIKLSDVAKVEDGQEEVKSVTIVDGQKAVGVDIRAADKANVVQVSEGVYKMMDVLDKIKPAGVNIRINYDQSNKIKASLKGVRDTLFEGAFLTIIIVFLFLKSWRSTVITGLTLPISLIGTLFAIYLCGFTLNMMSLLALALSIGLLIDDAIVVRENIVRHLHMGKDHYTAAMDGTNEIGLAVLATTLTLVAVFLPVGFMQGIIGKFFLQFGITVTVAVLISLFVSFTLDPMLSSIWHEPKDGGWLAKSWIGRYLDKFEAWFDKLIIWYEKIIRWSLRKRKTTLAGAVAILIGSFMLIPFIGGEFIPQSDKGQYTVDFRTSVGSNVAYTSTKVEQLSKILRDNIPEIVSITGGVNKNFGDGTNNASLSIDIGSKTTRKRSINQVISQTRELLSQVGGIQILNVMLLGGPGGDQKPINVDIKGANTEILKRISDDLMLQLAKVSNVADLQSSFQDANPAFDIKLDREKAKNLGVNLADIGGTLNTLFAGNKVGTWEDTVSGENYDVMVQIPEALRNVDALDMLKVPSKTMQKNNSPAMLSLSSITTSTKGEAPREIDHIDLQRKVTITGNIVGNNNQAVFAEVQNILDKYQLPDGYTFIQSGSKQDMEESFGYAISALLIGIAFIYLILTAQFRSFVLPIVIMIALPLSFVGVFVALFLSGTTLNMFSIIGIVMLMGLATKNGILLVDFIHQQLKEDVPLYEAIVAAGKTRLRPIVMTSAAMIFGMLPLALSVGDGSETRKPMAFAIIGGMTTSTILTLIVLPVIYVYVDKLSKWLTRKTAHSIE